MSERPPSSVSVAGGAEIRPLVESDHPLLLDLVGFGDNATVAGGLPIASPDFVSALRAEAWSDPTVLMQDGQPLGAVFIAAVDQQNQHARVVLLAREPYRCRMALAMFLRHLFWSHPLHRLYAVLPARPPRPGGYVSVVRACGFVSEGALIGHQVVDGVAQDVEIYGLLRSDFEAWCLEEQPQWLL